MLALDLWPSAVRLVNLQLDENQFTVDMVSEQPEVTCPTCQTPSRRVHSRYTRRLTDLPWAGRTVQLQVQVRRFFCDYPHCPRRTFVEPLLGLAQRSARQTERLMALHYQLALALGGEAGARLAQPLAAPTSGDHLLRLIRRTPCAPPATPRVLGVDEWAFKKGRTYGTLLTDQETGRPVELLPDRTAARFQAWLQQHPGIEIITRDRASAYAQAAAQAAPQAQQVADRWHLLRNLREVLQRFFGRQRAVLRQVKLDHPRPASAQAPTPPSRQIQPRAKRPSRDIERRVGHQLARHQRYTAVQQLHQQGLSHRGIARQLQLDRKTVQRYLHCGAPTLLPAEARQLEPYLPVLQPRWQAGCRSARQLYLDLRVHGYRGSQAAIWRWTARQRSQEVVTSTAGIDPTATTSPPGRALSPRQAAWILIQPAATLKPAEQAWLSNLQQACPSVATVYPLAQQFTQMIRQKTAGLLPDWLRAMQSSGLADLRGFAVSLQNDLAAVRAALNLPWSNGPTEGHVHRLKLIKRQMYGRAKFDLLRLRVLAAT